MMNQRLHKPAFNNRAIEEVQVREATVLSQPLQGKEVMIWVRSDKQRYMQGNIGESTLDH